MNVNKRRTSPGTLLRRELNRRMIRRRFQTAKNPEYPAFLVRLVGEARAKALFSEVIIHHRHD
jgi:hypothetical protein